MALDYPAEWKFAGPDEVPPIPDGVVTLFYRMLLDVAGGAGDQQEPIEGFKARFGISTGSSNLSWAESDLLRAMEGRAANSVRFVESLWLSIEDARAERLKTPTDRQLNALLLQNGVSYQVHDRTIHRVTGDAKVELASAEPSTDGQSNTALIYRLGDVIGRGGFGVVSRATRETSAAVFEYAFKLLDPSPFIDNPEKALLRFRREIRAIQKLQHRAIVPYVDAGFDSQGRPFLVMPYVDGVNIRDFTAGVPVSTVIGLMVDVLNGLDYAHSTGVLHRDLKPSNILVRTSDQQPIILDFGAAFVLDDLDSKSLTSAAVGTAGYIPPEVLADRTHRSVLHDVFSCAVITYELIARRLPNPQQYVALGGQRVDLVSELDGLLALSALDDVLSRALGPASGRPPSAGALRDSLRAAVPAR